MSDTGTLSLRPARSYRRGRPLVAVLAPVVLLVLVVVVVLHGVLLGKRAPAPITRITSTLQNMACIVDVSWSPDGRQIAVLGYQDGCPGDHSTPGALQIYNAATGSLVSQYQLDGLILQSHQITLGPVIQDPKTGQSFAPYIGYTAIIWSHGGRQLALPFIVFSAPFVLPSPTTPPAEVPASTTAVTTSIGVLLTNATGTQARVLAHSYQFAQTATPVPPAEWDLSTGTLVTARLSLAPALSYQWAAGGSALPQVVVPLSSTSAPDALAPGPVGAPIGGRSFTLWQPGEADLGLSLAALQSTTPGPLQPVPGVYLWYSSFAIWSPDGRYLITPAYYGGRVQLPHQSTPSQQDLAAAGQSQAVVLPAHDAALAQLYTSSGMILRPLAWRSDGRMLAALSYQQNANGSTSNVVTVYGTASGKTLARFVVPIGEPSSSPPGSYPYGAAAANEVGFFRWSPDSTHLLLMDQKVSGITIWGPGSLPQG